MEINRQNISFGMLKKSSLNNFERVFTETFKPPLEKMDKTEDLHKWALDRFLN